MTRFRYLVVPGLTSRWEVWLVSSWTGSRIEPVAFYENRGHALSRVRGLNRRLELPT